MASIAGLDCASVDFPTDYSDEFPPKYSALDQEAVGSVENDPTSLPPRATIAPFQRPRETLEVTLARHNLRLALPLDVIREKIAKISPPRARVFEITEAEQEAEERHLEDLACKMYLFGIGKKRDLDLKKWSKLVYGLKADAHAKRDRLVDLLVQLQQAYENLNDSSSWEEALARAEQFRSANANYEEGLRAAREASHKLEKATDHDARRKQKKKGLFGKHDLSDRTYKAWGYAERDFQKGLQADFEMAAKTEILTQEFIADIVRSSGAFLASARALPAIPPTLPSPDLYPLPLKAEAPAAAAFPGAEEYSAMPLTRHFVLESAKKALSPPPVSDAISALGSNAAVDPLLLPAAFSNTGLLEPASSPLDLFRMATLPLAAFYQAGKCTYGALNFFGNKTVVHKIETQLLKVDAGMARQYVLNDAMTKIPPNEAAKLLKLQESNFRGNLIRYTTIDPGRGLAEAHHVFPKNFGKQFKEMGIDPHDPRFGTWLDRMLHQELHNRHKYNKLWEESFFRYNPSPEKAFRMALELSEDYNFKTNL